MNSCGQAVNPWHLNSIATTNSLCDSSRLIYSTPSSHLKLEFLRIEKEVFGYLFLQQHRFTPSFLQPGHTELILIIDGTTSKQFLPLRNGSMRLTLPQETKEQIIRALQDEKEVAILLDGFQQTIIPSLFQERYREFVGGTADFFQFIKGPLE